MERKLLPDKTPIESGPIVISDNSDSFDLNNSYVSTWDFRMEALQREVGSQSELALRLSVEALINHLGLGILPPDVSAILETGEIWGPYECDYYYIHYYDYLKYFDVIRDHVNKTLKEPRQILLNQMQYVRESCDECRYYDTDLMLLEELPGAVYTFKRPNKHLEQGNLIEFEEFRNAANHPISTSPMKVAQVFDRVAQTLGDEKVKERFGMLRVASIPSTRRSIRDSIYIKTQALADLVQKLSSMPENEREGFNDLSMQILRFVLNDESSEDLMGDFVVIRS